MLNGAFTDPRITKVVHGAESDVAWLQRDFGLYLVGAFDTGQAARLLQLPAFSLAHLLKRICGVEADKAHQARTHMYVCCACACSCARVCM